MNFDGISAGDRLKLKYTDGEPNTVPVRVAYLFRPGRVGDYSSTLDTWVDVMGNIVAMRGWDAFLTYDKVGHGYFD